MHKTYIKSFIHFLDEKFPDFKKKCKVLIWLHLVESMEIKYKELDEKFKCIVHSQI